MTQYVCLGLDDSLPRDITVLWWILVLIILNCASLTDFAALSAKQIKISKIFKVIYCICRIHFEATIYGPLKRFLTEFCLKFI